MPFAANSGVGLWANLLGLGVLACAHAPTAAREAEGPRRLPILSPEYGGSADHPAAMGLGEALGTLELPLADGGSFVLGDALAAGPVILIWLGGAEHEELTSWVGALDRSLAQLEERAATLVFVRPLAAEAALRWAVELRVQTTVAGDPEGQLAAWWLGDGGDATPLEFAVLIARSQTLSYRKFGGRRPALAELLAVLDGEAAQLRCCPGPCVGEPCE